MNKRIHLMVWLGIVLLAFPMGTTFSSERSLNDILKELARYQPGQNDDILLALRQQVHAQMTSALNRSSCEEQLLAFLEGQATLDGKMEACRFLRIFGTERSVSVMGRMLLREKYSDMARYILEKISLESADVVLLQGLTQSQGQIKIGIITSLGQRKAKAATSELTKLLTGPEQLAMAAAASLGQIGDDKAIKALSNALNSTQGGLQIQVAASLLKCADDQSALGKEDVAFKLYQSVFSAPVDNSLRQAALEGKLMTTGKEAKAEIGSILKGQDEEMFTTAISLVPEFFSKSDISSLCRIFPGLPRAHKVQLLAVLSAYQTPEVLDLVLDAIKDSDIGIRIAALKALGQLGNAIAVDVLVQHAAQTSGKEQEIARHSLWGLSGEGVDEIILTHMSQVSDPEQQQELIRCIGERRIFTGKTLLLDIIQSEEAQNRVEAVRALKWLANPSDLSHMLDVLLTLPDSREQDEMAIAVALVAGQIPREDYRGHAVEKRLEDLEEIPGRSILYRVLGKIGDDSTLPVLRAALTESDETIYDAVVRAFAEWPTATAKDDVYKIAESASNLTYQVLALQAYIRMVSLEEYRMPEAVVASLESAFTLSTRPQEKITILSILPRYACEDGLKLAEGFSNDPDVYEEAQMAIEKIKERLEEAQKF